MRAIFLTAFLVSMTIGTGTAAAESETLFLDLNESSAQNEDRYPGPAASAMPLESGANYIVRIDGTFSLWTEGELRYRGICGTMEPSAKYPSPSPVAPSRVGIDPEHRFGINKKGACPSLPSVQNNMQMTAGAGFGRVAPQQPTAAYDSADHSYTYLLQGQGQIARFRFFDPFATDNNGRFRIRLERLTPETCASAAGELEFPNQAACEAQSTPEPPRGSAGAEGGGGVAGQTLRSPSCSATAGFRSTSVGPSKRGLQLRFSRFVANPVTISIYRTSMRRRVLLNRRLAKFTNRSRSLRWKGSSKVADGVYWVRYSIRTATGKIDNRRHTLTFSKGRFRNRPPHYRRASCGLVSSYKLEYPSWGGVTRRPLRISYILSRAATVTVTVRRGSRVVRRFTPTRSPRTRTVRLSLAPGQLRRGDYRVDLVATDARGTVTARLTSRKL